MVSSRCDRTARTVDIQTDVFGRIFRLKEKELGDNDLCSRVVDLISQENDPFLQKAGIDVTHLKKLRAIDEYASGFGVEVVPCIQTLAHLENMFKWYTEYEDIRDCDEIIVMDNGRVTAVGKHEELLKTSEIYREVYEQQTNGGDEDGK